MWDGGEPFRSLVFSIHLIGDNEVESPAWSCDWNLPRRIAERIGNQREKRSRSNYRSSWKWCLRTHTSTAAMNLGVTNQNGLLYAGFNQDQGRVYLDVHPSRGKKHSGVFYAHPSRWSIR